MERGLEPRIEILTHGLPSDEVALQVEAAANDQRGVDNHTNAVRGWHGRKFGRMPVKELVAHYTQKKADIREPSILIRINKNYHYGMTDAELYDATRSAHRARRGGSLSRRWHGLADLTGPRRSVEARAAGRVRCWRDPELQRAVDTRRGGRR
jgi:hypothetical protein